MKKLRILVLVHHYYVPPDDAHRQVRENADWKTEYDVSRTLRQLGHDVRILGVDDDLGVIRQAVDEFKPDIAFNLMEAFHEVGTFDMNVVSYLELLRLPYTGCNPRGMVLSRDKPLSKKLLSYHRIPTPDFAVIRRGRAIRLPARLTFPLIVKSTTEQASSGIAQASVVDDLAKLKERVAFIHESVGTDAIVEAFVDGRELYVGVIGNERLEVFPIWEMDFSGLPEGHHRIATSRVKSNTAYQRRHGITTSEARLPEGKAEEIQRLAKRVFRALELSGYARMDLRMSDEGAVYVLEANANPHLAEGEDLAASAKRAGLSYPDLLQRIINFGMRWQPERTG